MRTRVRADKPGGRLAFGSVTGSYQPLLSTTPGSGVILMISNSLNAEIVLSLDGGVTDLITLQPNHSPTFDFGTNNASFGGTVAIKHAGAAPSSGAISAGIIRVE